MAKNLQLGDFLCYDRVMKIPAELGIYELILFIALGLAILLFGYRIKKVAFFIVWFLLGFNLMNMLMPTLESWVPQIAGSDFWRILLPIAVGLLLALIGFSIEKLCVAGMCFALVMMVVTQYFGTEIQVLAVGAIIGVVVAGFAVTLMKPAIIIATSLMGAYVLTLVVFSVFSHLDSGFLYWPILIGIAAIGAIFQFATTQRIE